MTKLADGLRMASEATHPVREPDPNHHAWLIELRARVATQIADGRRTELIFDELVQVASERILGSVALLVTVGKDSVPKIRATTAPPVINHLIHGVDTRRRFGAWAAAITRQIEIVIPEIAASSLYAEHRSTFKKHGLLAARAAPLPGRHGDADGCLTVILDRARDLDDDEVDAFNELTSLAALALRREQERQEMLDRLHLDALTGLENRDGLEDHLRTALHGAQPGGPGVGLLFVDIDDLTLINDSLGHAAGDAIIKMTANRMQDHIMVSDRVVRFGGDEFIVVLDRVGSLHDARAVAERIRLSIREPFTIGDTALNTTVSIGITIGCAGTSPLDLIDEGHAAVVRAKQAGRGSTAEHDKELDTGAGERLFREQRLKQAIDEDELAVFWQPKVNLTTGKIAGAEALVRWIHPELGVLGPDQFIPTAERAALIDDLSDWVLHQAIAEAVDLTEHLPGFSTAINMSATQIGRSEIDDVVAAALDTNSLHPNNLIIELTESLLANKDVVKGLYRLRENGVKLAIDDFGTGYSSLAYVRQLPVGIVKVDRAFLVGLEADGTGAPVLAAAVAMAHALGKSTTVEGIETPEQLAGLRELQVDWGQGYFFAEPQPLDAMLAQIDKDPTW